MTKGFEKKMGQSVADGSTEEVYYSNKPSASEVAVVMWLRESVIRLDI